MATPIGSPSWSDMATQELQRMFSHPELRSLAAGLIGSPRANYDAITGMAPTGTSTDYSNPRYSAPLEPIPRQMPAPPIGFASVPSAFAAPGDTQYLPPVAAPAGFLSLGSPRMESSPPRMAPIQPAEAAAFASGPSAFPAPGDIQYLWSKTASTQPATVAPGGVSPSPAAPIGAAPVAASPPLPEGVRAMSAGGVPYYRNDSLGAPLLSDTPAGATAAGFGQGPTSLNALVASQRPDLYNPDGTPRIVGLGGQAVDPGLGQALESMQRLSAALGMTGQGGRIGAIVGGVTPQEQAIRDIQSSNLSEGTKLRRISEVNERAAREAASQRSADTELERARLASETQRDVSADDIAARRDIAKMARDTQLERARILSTGMARETTEETPIRVQTMVDPTNPTKSSVIMTQGNYVGQGATALEAQANLQERILAPFLAEFPRALENPAVRARMEEKYGTKDIDKMRTEYLRDALRMSTTRVRRTQPMSDYGTIGVGAEE